MKPLEPLSDAVQELVRERIHSIEELEALILLRSEPSRHWSDRAVSDALKISPALTRSALYALVQKGLCSSLSAQEGPTKFAPQTLALERKVAELAAAYGAHRIEVLVFISQSAISRVRNGALRIFAQAFCISSQKKSG